MGEEVPDWYHMWGAKVKTPVDMPDDMLKDAIEITARELDTIAAKAKESGARRTGDASSPAPLALASAAVAPGGRTRRAALAPLLVGLTKGQLHPDGGAWRSHVAMRGARRDESERGRQREKHRCIVSNF